MTCVFTIQANPNIDIFGIARITVQSNRVTANYQITDLVIV